MNKLQKKNIIKETSKPCQDVSHGLDFSFQGIKYLSSSIFQLCFLKELNFRGNELECIPVGLHCLTNLEILNFSRNKIKHIPKNIGKMVNLKELILSDNLISTLPMEIGALYNLKTFDLNNNPLINPFNILYKDKKLLQYCREHNSSYQQPADRTWVNNVIKKQNTDTSYSFGTFNILSNYQASKLEYPPMWILNPEYRKENILHSICSFDLDVLGLQEVEVSSYKEFFKDQLDMRCDYDSFYTPRGRVKLMPESKTIDGCATFWKKSKFKLIEPIVINFYDKFLQDPRFASADRLHERYGKKDNIALVTVLQSTTEKKTVIVVNVHLYWDPDYSDIKLLQTIILIEQLNIYKKKYHDASVVAIGDFNSIKKSEVYDYIVNGSHTRTHDLVPGISFINEIVLRDAYANEENDFTNFTPIFKGVIDYIFYSKDLELVSVLSGIEKEYNERVVGLPNIHFPSDHMLIASKFVFI